MRAGPTLIVGQGLAGTLLAWEFERAGIAFEIADGGHAAAASRIAAGIINPITGQRLVKSWKVDTLLPLARESYRAFEQELGVPVWREMRVRRLYLNDTERRVFAEKRARGDLANYAGASDHEGFWIEGAAHVDVATLIHAARARWVSAGVLREERVDFGTVTHAYERVIDCTGSENVSFEFVPWQYSKGECLTVTIDGLAPDVVLNRGHWMVPVGTGVAKVGATHSPGRRDLSVTPEARANLEAGVGGMSSKPFSVTDQHAGIRTYLGDKRPVVGLHPHNPRLGLLNGLGAKGTLFAPALARQWVHHLREGVPFDSDVDVSRLCRTARLAAVGGS